MDNPVQRVSASPVRRSLQSDKSRILPLNHFLNPGLQARTISDMKTHSTVSLLAFLAVSAVASAAQPDRLPNLTDVALTPDG
jgi:hypothetical protein